MTADPKRAGFVVISQVKEHRVTVVVTMTSILMSNDDADQKASEGMHVDTCWCQGACAAWQLSLQDVGHFCSVVVNQVH